MSDWVELGRIGSPFGVRGWVHVQSFTDPPESLFAYRRWNLPDGRGGRRVVQLAEAKAQGNGLVARLEGFEDRTAAETLKGRSIEVARAQLPPTGKGEYYRADLIGLAVRSLDGVELGVVAHFVEAPAGALMVVRGDAEHWVPATPQYLKKVDLGARQILVDWPVAGHAD